MNEIENKINYEITHKIDIKTLSVNKAWQGRRYKTNDYKAYEEEMLLRLPKKKKLKGELGIDIEIGLSQRYSVTDVDNKIKLILDIFQKKGYYKNDSQICELLARKVKSKKDYVFFRIYEIE